MKLSAKGRDDPRRPSPGIGERGAASGQRRELAGEEAAATGRDVSRKAHLLAEFVDRHRELLIVYRSRDRPNPLASATQNYAAGD